MDVDPWAVILRHSRWYLLCWSHARDARRVLRVDRIASAAALPGTFAPPTDLDPLRALEEHLSQGWKFPVDVLIDAPPAEVAWWLPRSLGTLSPAGDGQTRLLASTEAPEWYAGRLAALPYTFRVNESAPLRDALAELARRDVETERSVADAANLFDVVADFLEHLADLAIAALRQGEFVPGVVASACLLDLCRCGDDAVAPAAADFIKTAAIDHDAAAELVDAFTRGSAGDFDEIGLLDASGCLGELVCEVAVVGHQEQAFAEVVEPTYRV